MPLRQLNLNDLIALDALLRERHVTRAASRAGISQSAMSHSLRRLRERLDDQLLVRGTNGYVLTPRAERLGKAIRHALSELEMALFDQNSFEPIHSIRRYTVGCSDSANHPLVVYLVPQLQREAPNASLLVRPIGTGELLLELDRREIDLAVIDSPPPPGARSRPLWTEPYVCVLREDHPAARTWSLDTYLCLPHAAVCPNGEYKSAVEDALEMLGFETRVVSRIPSASIGPMLAANADVVATLPRWVAYHLSRNLPIQVLEMPIEIPPLEFTMVWDARNDSDPAHQWLRDKLAAIPSLMSAPEIARLYSTHLVSSEAMAGRAR